jgi:diaminopimelate decarboxylase
MDLAALAHEYGTPLYVYDRFTMDASVHAYRDALRGHYPGEACITYAGKAFLCTAVAEWIRARELWVDCTGEGEIGIAVNGGVMREAIVVHGVNKSVSDIEAARARAGTIVVDNITELQKLANIGEPLPHIWLRLLPGLAVRTHHSHTQTGQRGSKFGMTPSELGEAAQFCKAQGLALEGVHFHLGSNFRDPAPLVGAIVLALDVAKTMELGEHWHLCPGGGWSVAYHEDELPQPDAREYVRLIAEAVIEKCKADGVPLPILHLEPGRSLVARAGVAIYRVGTVKRRPDHVWLLVDGGMADNPRHALYGSRYSCLPVQGQNREASDVVAIAGPHCESGDVLIEDLPMPRIEEGELIAVPASGAYQLSMSSNYNGARRPAVVFVESGHARLAVHRETVEDLMRRDAGQASAH